MSLFKASPCTKESQKIKSFKYTKPTIIHNFPSWLFLPFQKCPEIRKIVLVKVSEILVKNRAIKKVFFFATPPCSGHWFTCFARKGYSHRRLLFYQIILPEIRMEGILSTGNVTVKSGIHLKKNCVLKSEIQLKFYRDGLFKKSQIKSETVMSWSSRKKKQGIFCTANLVSRDFFNIFVLSQCIVY